jgi:sigma-E factor negative regulatory protein RseC
LIESPARIQRLEGDIAWVVSEAPSSCGACAGKGCGSSVFARFWHADLPEYPVANPIGAQPGDAVVIGLPEGALLHAALASYGLPLTLLLAGAAAGGIPFGEPGAIGGGLCGLILAALWLKLADRLDIWPHADTRPTPSVLRLGTTSGCRND